VWQAVIIRAFIQRKNEQIPVEFQAVHLVVVLRYYVRLIIVGPVTRRVQVFRSRESLLENLKLKVSIYVIRTPEI